MSLPTGKLKEIDMNKCKITEVGDKKKIEWKSGNDDSFLLLSGTPGDYSVRGLIYDGGNVFEVKPDKDGKQKITQIKDSKLGDISSKQWLRDR